MIFVDTSFWVALAFPRDSRHGDASRLQEAHDRSALTTSNHVRGETWTVLGRRAGHHVASHFLDLLDESSQLRIEFVSRDLEEEALRWLRRHDEREYSYVDATSFALMRKLRVHEAFAFDGDFAAAGFTELRA